MTTRVLTACIVLSGIGALLTPVDTLAGAEGRTSPVPPALGRGVVRPPLIQHFPEMRFRHHTGPVWWGYAPDIANDYAPDTGYPYPPVQGFYERSGPAANFPRCRTQSQKVPSEAGGERTINITHCY
jgi:hypothetical protein